jgi:hypothetical protein
MHEIILNTHIHSHQLDGQAIQPINDRMSKLPRVGPSQDQTFGRGVEGYMKQNEKSFPGRWKKSTIIPSAAEEPPARLWRGNELCTLAADTQRLINAVNQCHGYPLLPTLRPDARLVMRPLRGKWDVHGYTASNPGTQ